MFQRSWVVGLFEKTNIMKKRPWMAHFFKKDYVVHREHFSRMFWVTLGPFYFNGNNGLWIVCWLDCIK